MLGIRAPLVSWAGAVLLGLFPVQAADYYVSPTGSDIAPGTLSHGSFPNYPEGGFCYGRRRHGVYSRWSLPETVTPKELRDTKQAHPVCGLQWRICHRGAVPM